MELPTFLCYLALAVLMSVKSQGLRCLVRRKVASSYFLHHRQDIILLQETQWKSNLEMQIKR